MVRHTLKSLGPKVLADRMVRDYVTKLYSPAAQSSRDAQRRLRRCAASSPSGSTRSATGWSAVAIDHVESSGVSDAPEIGDSLEVRAFVSLGGLSPEDVDVQVVHGRVRHEDDLVDTTIASLAPPSPTRAAGTASRARSTLATSRTVRLHRAGAAEERAPGLAGRARAGRAAVGLTRRAQTPGRASSRALETACTNRPWSSAFWSAYASAKSAIAASNTSREPR